MFQRLNIDIGEALRKSEKNKASKQNQDHDCLKRGNKKVHELINQEFVGLSGRNERTSKKTSKIRKNQNCSFTV